MQDQRITQNAVAAIRVSTTKQGTEGDSPEAQKEQIKQFASTHNINIKETFIFLESASKKEQPMQKAINFCKDPKNDIQLFIVKSIDRLTRGGGSPYDQLKLQLENCNVSLVDIYGIISSQKVNTLEHLGLKYKWSEYSPSQKTEYLEAERAKDELRDIMSRMIGAEVRYTRMGYWMRQAPYGFVSEKIETHNGKRCVLRPHPKEAPLLRKMYELRAKGTMHDSEIVEQLNNLGFKSRARYKRSQEDHTKIVSQIGGDPLTIKSMQKLLKNTIYAGINVEKWTEGKPVRCAFDGLVSIELFNRANKGSFNISVNGDQISVHKRQPPDHLVNKGIRDPDFPYRRFVRCSECGRPMLGSASRGKNGKYYPAYHCSNHGHYYRIAKEELEATVAEFISYISVSQEHIDNVVEAVVAEWNKRQSVESTAVETIDARINDLKSEATLTVGKMKVLNSETALKFMEDDLVRIEKQIELLTAEKAEKEAQKPTDIHVIMGRVKYFLENLDQLLLKQIDPVKKAQFFGALFDEAPTYEELKPGNQKTPLFTGVNQLFALARMEKSLMVTHVDQTWNSLLVGIERIDTSFDDLEIGRKQ